MCSSPGSPSCRPRSTRSRWCSRERANATFRVSEEFDEHSIRMGRPAREPVPGGQVRARDRHRDAEADSLRGVQAVGAVMAPTHRYETVTTWAGNLGTGTSGYRAYSRDHHISTPVKSAPILASSDPAFRGDRTRYNPEELLVGALSACHMLWVLHL